MKLSNKFYDFKEEVLKNKSIKNEESSQFLIDEYFTLILFELLLYFSNKYQKDQILSLYEYQKVKFDNFDTNDKKVFKELRKIINRFAFESIYSIKSDLIENSLDKIENIVKYIEIIDNNRMN